MILKKLALLSIVLLTLSCSEAEQSFSNLEVSEGLATTAAVGEWPKFPSAVDLYARKADDEMVDGEGKVIKLLSDDNKGSRHQRFIVEIEKGHTLLFAHNIDLAKRINTLNVGDAIQFRGEFSYNEKGGIVHWTHHDPQGLHEPGWIKHDGVTYQ